MPIAAPRPPHLVTPARPRHPTQQEHSPPAEPAMLSPLPTFCDPVVAQAIAAEISNVLGRIGNDWRGASLAAKLISLQVAQRLRQSPRGDLRRRAGVHAAAARAILSVYLQLWDDERDVADLVNDAVNAMADLAPPATAADPVLQDFRREILREILEIQLWDAYHGGQYMGDTADRRLESLATPEERQWLLTELFASFARYGGRDYHFGRQCVGRIGLNMAGDSLSAEALEALLREAGLSTDLARSLLGRGDVDGALAVLRGAHGSHLAGVVEAFNAAGHGQIAAPAALLHPALMDPECDGLARELATEGVAVPASLAALSSAVSRLVGHPGLAEYRRLRELAMACGRWPAVLDSVTFRSENSKVVPLLARIHAARGDAASAQAVLARLAEAAWSSAALEVAEELATLQPLAAAELLRELIALYEAKRTKPGREKARELQQRLAELAATA